MTPGHGRGLRSVSSTEVKVRTADILAQVGHAFVPQGPLASFASLGGRSRERDADVGGALHGDRQAAKGCN